MAIKIVVSDTVSFKVQGSINDAAGIAQPFSFTLKCSRLNTEDLQSKIKSDGDVIDFLNDVIEDWSGVKDADDKPLPYTEASLRALCTLPGISMIAYRTYLTECGAKEKN